VQHAEAVHEPLGLVARGVETIGDHLVGDHRSPAPTQGRAAGPKRLDGTREVMQRLKNDDDVEWPVARHDRGRERLKSNLDACRGSVAPSVVDRGGVSVESDHLGVGIGARQCDGRPALPAADVGDPDAGSVRRDPCAPRSCR